MEAGQMGVFGAMALFIGGYATSQYWNLRLTGATGDVRRGGPVLG